MSDDDLRRQIREARGKFAAMAGTYALGVFNDQFYKQAACLLAISVGMKWLQGWVVFAFTLPYIAFAAYAGWLADRFPKNRVVVGAKVLELAAMICGGIGIATQSWPLVLVMACIMGWQSCIFSPALNGSIPELYPPSYVTTANGILKVFVTVSILAGIAAAGPALDIKGMGPGGMPMGQLAVAVGVVSISALGVVVSFFAPRRPAADVHARFPWTGPIDTVCQLWRTTKDRMLSITIWADMFIWFAGSIQVLLINVMGLNQFKYSKTVTSYLLVSEVMGVAVGGVLASCLAKGKRWHWVLVPSALVMSLALGAVMLVPGMPVHLQMPALLVLLGVSGIAGGTFMIPCEAFIQVRPAPERRGTIIASANFAIFAGILASGPIANWLNAHIVPTTSFALLAVVALLAAATLFLLLPKRRQDP